MKYNFETFDFNASHIFLYYFILIMICLRFNNFSLDKLFQANGDRIYANGFIMTAKETAELTQFNTLYPLNSSIFDESYINKLIAKVDMRQKGILEFLKGIFFVNKLKVLSTLVIV